MNILPGRLALYKGYISKILKRDVVKDQRNVKHGPDSDLEPRRNTCWILVRLRNVRIFSILNMVHRLQEVR